MQMIEGEDLGGTRPALTEAQLAARKAAVERHQAELNGFSNLTPDQLAQSDKPPTWMDVYNVFNTSHIAKYGIPMNRAWSDNAGDAKTAIDNLYTQGLAAWNTAHKQNVPVDQSVIGVNAQPNQYTPEKHSSMFGDLLLPILAIAAVVVGAAVVVAAVVVGGCCCGCEKNLKKYICNACIYAN
jgi:hypothetical protein